MSARLPRIMDATVTHVNEACHLHLLRLRRPAFSPRVRPTPWITPWLANLSTPTQSPAHLPRPFVRAVNRSAMREGVSLVPSVFNFISQLRACYFLFFVGERDGCQSRITGEFDRSVGQSLFTIGSASVTPTRDARSGECRGCRADADRV